MLVYLPRKLDLHTKIEFVFARLPHQLALHVEVELALAHPLCESTYSHSKMTKGHSYLACCVMTRKPCSLNSNDFSAFAELET